MSQSGIKLGQDFRAAALSKQQGPNLLVHLSSVCQKPSWASNYHGNIPEPSDSYAI